MRKVQQLPLYLAPHAES